MGSYFLRVGLWGKSDGNYAGFESYRGKNGVAVKDSNSDVGWLMVGMFISSKFWLKCFCGEAKWAVSVFPNG